jgi:hypothetical protein
MSPSHLSPRRPAGRHRRTTVAALLAGGLASGLAVASPARADTVPAPEPGAAVGVASVGGGAAETAVDLFYRRTDDGLVQRNGEGDTDLGGILSSGVAAIATRPGGGDLGKSVYVRGANGGVWFRSWSAAGGWAGWASLGGRSAGTPAVTCTPAGGGAPVVFTRGVDDALWRRDATAWVSLGGALASDPAGLASVGGTCPGAQHVFALGTDQSVWEWSSAAGWAKVGGRSTVAPSATLLPDGGTDLFARGLDGVAYVAHRPAGAAAFGAFRKAGTTTFTSPVTGFVDTTVPADRLVLGHRTDGSLWVLSDELGGAASWVVAQVP